MKTTRKNGDDDIKKSPPGQSPEESEMRCIAAAVNLAEEQLRNGTASSAVITHYLKLGSTRAQLETERLKLENENLKAKTEALQAQKMSEEMVAEAIRAFKRYAGDSNSEEEEWND